MDPSAAAVARTSDVDTPSHVPPASPASAPGTPGAAFLESLESFDLLRPGLARLLEQNPGRMAPLGGAVGLPFQRARRRRGSELQGRHRRDPSPRYPTDTAATASDPFADGAQVIEHRVARDVLPVVAPPEG